MCVAPLFTVCCIMQALLMAPLAALGGPLLMRAAVATGAIVGCISLTAATAPSQAYLSMTGPLAIGAGLVIGASLGSMFFPGANFLYTVVLYGGVSLRVSRVQSISRAHVQLCLAADSY